jgi:hypothetical protein
MGTTIGYRGKGKAKKSEAIFLALDSRHHEKGDV